MSSRWMRCLAVYVCLLCCIALLLPSSAHSQAANAGSIAGLVSDSSGAAVAGATVTVTDRGTGTPRTAVSNDAGRYFFPNLTPGVYQLEASRTGFRLVKVPDLQVTVGSPLTVDLKLEVGSISETVEVTTTGTELQTTNSTLGTTLSGDSLLMLPNIGHDISHLLVAQPGVTPDGYSAGASYDQNTYQLDGGNNSNDMDGSMSIYTPTNGSSAPNNTGGVPSGVMPTPAESIEEFKVSTANQTADYNGASGAQVQLVTKRGTNQWHGSAYEYYLGSNFGANTWDNNFNQLPKPSTHQNRFGAAAGGPILPAMLGGKTYFFANYEGFRYPLATTFERAVPSATLRQGIINIGGTEYNFNPANGPTAVCQGGPCDPRGLWFNPAIQQIWSQFEPLPNDLTNFGDHVNTQGYIGNLLTPVTSDFGVARLDHDFGKKWHFMSSYRFYRFTRGTNVQTDIGGFFPGNTLGQIASTAQRPQKPWYLVAGLTTNISANLTNDFHFSYLRNFWSWQDALAPPQLAGIPGAIEISPAFGNSKNVAESRQALIPYNVNTQDVRIRHWDGHDWFYRDDLSYIRGNHLWQFGGLFQHNWDYHVRDDNGSGTFNNPVFLVSKNDSGVNIPAAYQPAGLTATQIAAYNPLYVDLLGISGAQVAFTRAGKDLALQPLGQNAFDKSVIDTYNIYFSDTWHLKPSLTLNYGLGYLVETPPLEESGKQITLVDTSGNQIGLKDYLSARQRAALQGQIYNPILGYSLVGNVGKGLKYPYEMFWGGLSPRVSLAWNPKFDNGLFGQLFGAGKTVIRGGYARTYGRQNGVDLVLVPLLGVGLIQAVKCPGASISGACLGSGNTDPTNAFRIGIDPNPANLYQQGISNTLCQPFFPGEVNCDGNTAARASDTLVLDPHFKPAHSDEFDLMIQRDLGHNTTLEVGYIGRILRDEYMNVNIDQVPWMLTLGGQSFAQAYAAVEKQLCGLTGPTCAGNTAAVTAQPFFEAALGPGGTAAVLATDGGNFSAQNVYQLWASMENPANYPGTTLANSTIGAAQATSVQMSGAFGRGNYNAAIISVTQRNWKGLTVNTNFTWSRSLGTQFYAQANNGINPNNGYDLKNFGSYGPQPYDLKFVYNLQSLYNLPFYRTQRGVIGRVLGGWSVAPLLLIRSGYPLYVYTDGNCSDESSGQGNCSSGNLPTNALPLTHINAGSSRHLNVAGSGGVGGGNGMNLFSNPEAVYNSFRPFILGLDGPNGGGGGPLRGLSQWNMDLTVSKDIHFTERFGLMFVATFSNLTNHPQFHDPYLDLQDPGDFGVISGGPFGLATQSGSQGNGALPRQIEFGLRFRF
jgi:hypothetical protein